MNILIDYIANDTIITGLINNNVYLIDKPDTEKISPDNYVVCRYKELSGGYITKFSVEYDIIGKDINILLQIKERIIQLLNDPRNEKTIKDENTTVRTSQLLNGGGMIRNPETGNYQLVVFFVIQI